MERMRQRQLIVLITLFLLFTACKKQHLTNDFCDCEGSQTTYIRDTVTLTIPNLFTPNGDVINDYWIIENINMFPDRKIKVTRPGLFGGTVFESSSGDNKLWNGENENHKTLKDGKYNYEITIDGQTITGNVCIYRGAAEPEHYDCLESCVTSYLNDPVIN